MLLPPEASAHRSSVPATKKVAQKVVRAFIGGNAQARSNVGVKKSDRIQVWCSGRKKTAAGHYRHFFCYAFKRNKRQGYGFVYHPIGPKTTKVTLSAPVCWRWANNRRVFGVNHFRCNNPPFKELPPPPPAPSPPPGPQDNGDFIVTYFPSDDYFLNGLVSDIEESNWLDWYVDFINRTYALPVDINVYVLDEVPGPAYFPDPDLLVITMPPEFLAMTIDLFEGWWDDHKTIALQAFAWVFLHEVGHALIDQLNIPITGLEEDAVDQFATVTMLSQDAPWPAYDAAVLFRLLGENRGAARAAHYWDEHSLHEQRDTNILCWLYGYDPFKFVFVPTRFPESGDRLERCGYEYQQVKTSWETLLAPYVKK